MRKPIIAGNWKMNKTLSEAEEFIKAVKDNVPSNDVVDAVVGAPNIFTPKIIEWTEGSDLQVSAQNSHFEDSGAFTGEASPKALAEMGTDYVILGHSERRNIFHETDEEVNKKVHAVLDHDMTPIICVGESLDQRESGETKDWVSGQIEAALEGVTADQVKGLILAYEPIWAIGTGKTATAEQANDTIKEAREKVADLYDADTADAVRFQYGGSVKPANVDELLAQSDIDGALVGGASLEADSFLKLLEAANK
ncbi:MAG: triose-phosphate isomerase [Atopostipes suicloacalis]|nr:triose-phosphate isomerase [Atopostipes suicloacalis]